MLYFCVARQPRNSAAVAQCRNGVVRNTTAQHHRVVPRNTISLFRIVPRKTNLIPRCTAQHHFTQHKFEKTCTRVRRSHKLRVVQYCKKLTRTAQPALCVTLALRKYFYIAQRSAAG
jgi:hypothetical protein